MRPSGPALAVVVLVASSLAAANASAGAKDLRTVAMDVRQVDDAAYRALDLLGLQRKLALRLSQAGFAVVGLAKQPQIRLQLSVGPSGDAIVIEAVIEEIEGRPSGQTVRRDASSDLESFHLEVIHKAVQAARRLAARLASTTRVSTSRPASAPASRPATRPTATPAARGPKIARQPAHLELAASAGALLRLDGVDPLLRLGARWGRQRGLGGWLVLSATVPTSDEPVVFEWTAQLGPAWRLVLGERVDLEIALLGGLLLHSYWLEGAQPDSGSSWDFVGDGTATLGWRPRRWLRLVLVAGGGTALRSRQHRLDGREVWRRSAVRLQISAGAIFCL